MPLKADRQRHQRRNRPLSKPISNQLYLLPKGHHDCKGARSVHYRPMLESVVNWSGGSPLLFPKKNIQFCDKLSYPSWLGCACADRSVAAVSKRKSRLPCQQDGHGDSISAKRMRCSIPSLPEVLWLKLWWWKGLKQTSIISWCLLLGVWSMSFKHRVCKITAAFVLIYFP
jgi:hypothetical protein